jgi:stage V sporulation protein B
MDSVKILDEPITKRPELKTFNVKKHKKTVYGIKNPVQINHFSTVFSLAFPLAVSGYLRAALGTAEHLIIPMGLRAWGADYTSALSSYGILCGMVIPLLYFPSAVLSAFSSLLIPELSYEDARGHARESSYIVGRALSVTLLFSFLVSGIFISFSNELGIMLYNSAEASCYIRLLSPLIPLMYLDMATDTMLKGLGDHIYSMRVNIADSVISIILLLALLPKFGIKGYIVTLFITELFNTSMSIVRLLNRTGIQPPFLKWVAKPLLAVILSTFIARTVFVYLAPLPKAPLLILQIAVTVLFYLIISMLTGAVSKEDMAWAKSIIASK